MDIFRERANDRKEISWKKWGRGKPLKDRKKQGEGGDSMDSTGNI